MGQIIKIHDQVFEAPTRENLVKQQIKFMGERYIAHPKSRGLPPAGFQAFLMRQDRRQREAARAAK